MRGLVIILLQFSNPASRHQFSSSPALSSGGLPTLLSLNPLKEKAWMGIQSPHRKDWTRSANKAAKSLSSPLPPPRMPLPHLLLPPSPPSPAFISGDKGLFVGVGGTRRLASRMEECGTSLSKAWKCGVFAFKLRLSGFSLFLAAGSWW